VHYDFAMGSLLQDLRYALRVLLKNPGFTAAAIAVLALGIGANSAIFSVVNAVLLRPFPFPDSDQLVQVYHVPPAASFPGVKRFAVSPGNYIDWRASGRSFDGMAAYGPRQFALTGMDRVESVRGATVGADFFTILRAQPELGHFPTADDDLSGRSNVAVISHSFWQSHFGSSPDVLGKSLILNGALYSIVGVARPNLHFPAWSATAGDVWIPLAWDAKTRAIRKNHNYIVIARLKPGVAMSQAQAEMNTISSQLERVDPEANKDWGAVVTSLRANVVNNIRPVLLVLLGAVAFVLLIACANVANLITARNLARRKEIAVRAALGASRNRALQQLLSETVVLSLAGGLAGLAAAKAIMPLLATYVTQQFPLASEIPLDASVLWFTLGVSLATGILAGALPAWRGSKANLNDVLKQGSRGGSDSGGRRVRNGLVAAEVALSLMLLVGAGLMVRSLWLLSAVNPGFDPKNVLTLTVVVSTKPSTQPVEIARHYDQVLDRVRALPGVESAGLTEGLPFQGGSNVPIVIEGRPAALFAQQPVVPVRNISPGYLHTMRIPVLRGRDISNSDVAGTSDVALISESMAKRFWPGEDPIGKHVTLSFTPDKPREVIGIVGDVKQNGLDDNNPPSTLYAATAQQPISQMSLAVRTTLSPETLTSAVTAAVQELDRDQPVRNVKTMQALLDQTVSDRHMSMLLLVAFAALALVLAAFGLYSVLAYTVRRRVREIGIRMALGASVNDVLRMVVTESFRPTLAGIVIGLAGSLALSSLLAKLIYGVKPTDPATFTVVALILAAVAIIASIIPAWRATRVDPLQALREE
jgi:putative ABC transport system permease protein